MKPKSLRGIKWNEGIFITAVLLVLTVYQLFQNMAFTRTHLPELFLWNFFTLIASVGTAKLLERSIFRNWFRCSFLRIATTRMSLYFVLSILLAAAGMYVYKQLLGDNVPAGLFWRLFLFHSLIYFGSTVIIEVSRLAGSGFLDKLILGKYHHPRKERRIFLFIDLKESTRLSKELSLENYSLLIKEFFREVDKAMEKFGGEIYQYAGDEVIVSWPAVPGNYDKAVASFLEFYNQMKAKRAYFEKQYGVVPRFKSAMHSGKVVGTWVGRMKRELVYQGEVLNIAARITGLAKSLSYPILLTQPIINKLSEPLRQKALLGGSYSLKGVDYPVTVYFLQTQLRTNQIVTQSTWAPSPSLSEPIADEYAINN